MHTCITLNAQPKLFVVTKQPAEPPVMSHPQSSASGDATGSLCKLGRAPCSLRGGRLSPPAGAWPARPAVAACACAAWTCKGIASMDAHVLMIKTRLLTAMDGKHRRACADDLKDVASDGHVCLDDGAHTAPVECSPRLCRLLLCRETTSKTISSGRVYTV